MHRRHQLLNLFFLAFTAMALVAPSTYMYRNIFYLGIVPATLWSLWRRDNPWGPGSAAPLLVVAFVVFLSLNSFATGYATTDAAITHLRWGLQTLLVVLALFFVTRFWIRSPVVHGRFFLGVTVVVAVWVLVPYILQGNFGVRLAGEAFLSHTIEAASVLLALWTVGFALLVLGGRMQSWDYVLLGVSALCTLVFVVFTQSRGPLLALAITFVMALVTLASPLSRSRVLMLLSIGLVLALPAVAVSYYQPTWFVWLQETMLRGTSYRPEIWSAVLSEAGSSWLIGFGSAAELPNTPVGDVLRDEVGRAFAHTHNLFFETYFSGGIIALTLLLAVLVMALAPFLQFRNRPRLALVVATIVAMLVAVHFTDAPRVIGSVRPEWIMFWLPLVLAVQLGTAARAGPEGSVAGEAGGQCRHRR